MLPALYDRYTRLIGTDKDFPDLAVGAAMARHDLVTAEVKAADCYVYKQHSVYPACVKLLGYDPLAKGAKAKTPEGQKAFMSKGLEGSLSDLFGGALKPLYSN